MSMKALGIILAGGNNTRMGSLSDKRAIAAMPVASVSVMFANQYGGNANMASKGVFITTMCSFITIPILCMFLAKRF